MNMTKERIYARPKRLMPDILGLCAGCGHGLFDNAIFEVLEELGSMGRASGGFGIGCGNGLIRLTELDVVQAAHGTAAAVASGIKRSLFGKPIVFTRQGDGDCAAIGLGYLVNAAARGEKLTVFMINNANYGTTGGQMAPTTITGQITTTTPEGRDPKAHGYPLHVPELLASMKGVAYCARGALNNPANYQRTKRYMKTALQKQIDDIGFSFVDILSACPPDWHLTPVESLRWIEEKMIPEFPLGEFKNVDRIA